MQALYEHILLAILKSCPVPNAVNQVTEEIQITFVLHRNGLLFLVRRSNHLHYLLHTANRTAWLPPEIVRVMQTCNTWEHRF